MARLKGAGSYEGVYAYRNTTHCIPSETPIITSILDTDAYKLHMQQAVFHQLPDIPTTIKFYNRNSDDCLGVYAHEIEHQIRLMSNICLTDDEYSYLSTLPQFKEDYLDYLRTYRFNPEQVRIEAIPLTSQTNTVCSHSHDSSSISSSSSNNSNNKQACNASACAERVCSAEIAVLPTPAWNKLGCGCAGQTHNLVETDVVASQLSITITGPWLETILWEVPVLAIITEVVQSHRHPSVGVAEALSTLNRSLDSFVAMHLDEEEDTKETGGLFCASRVGREGQTLRVQGQQTDHAGSGSSGKSSKRSHTRTPPTTVATTGCCVDCARNEKDVTLNEDKLRGFAMVDFGTRRRFSRAVQEAVVRMLCADCRCAAYMSGTSNFDLARRLGLRAVGTQAHEWFQAFQQLTPELRQFQSRALQVWLDEYPNILGIALTDCINMDSFLRDFPFALANAFDGLRHDSGDAEVWARKAIEHYRQLGIDPRSKTLVFSDGLTMEKAARLYYKFKNDIDVVCGVGTQLTCRITGVRPLNVVMKMVECNGKPVAKVTDSVGKIMVTDDGFITRLCAAFDVDYQPPLAQ